MKKIFHFIFACLIISYFFACTSQPAEVVKSDRLDTKYQPDENFLLQRSYPDDQFDIRAYTRALKQARAAQSLGSRGLDTEWTVQGPGNIGGRINTMAVHPTNEDIIYAGFGDGGVFKTMDGGLSWNPIFDDQLFLAIGTIAIDPVDPNTIYVGTGDPNVSGLPSVGDGVYKSTDGGDTWTHLGLEAERIVSKIAIDPTNTDVVYTACMGLPFAPTPNRGVYKSMDGGQNWEQILFLSDSTGVIDMVMDPFDANVLYAAGWDRIRNNSRSLINGEGAKIYRTKDGGQNWEVLGNGLPDGPQSRIGLTTSGVNPNVVFAMVVGTNQNLEGIYKSTDGGDSWAPIPTDEYDNNLSGGALGGFGWYFGKLRVNPRDDNDIYLLGVDLWRTTDGGNFWDRAAPQWWTYEVHADKHDLVFTTSGNLVLGTDGGAYRSTDNAANWSDLENIATTQFYRVAFNPHEPDFYYGGAQDNGTTGGNALDINNWPRIYGGDGFQPAFDPVDPMKMYAETQNGGIVFSIDGGYSWNSGRSGIDFNDRRNWDMPYIISPHSNQVLYTGTYRAYQGMTGADTLGWTSISDDLTEGTDNRFHTITTLDESPILEGLLYYGATDGYVNRRDPETGDWVDIAAGLPVRYVTDIKASPDFQNGVYVTHSGYKDNDNIPRVHRSVDRGQNWEDISGDLPDLAVNDIYILPNNQDSVLFVATDGGVYASTNRGQNWNRLGTGMPYIPVFDLELNVARNELIAGTFARSIMSFPLDSIGVSSDIMVSVSPNPLVRELVKLSPNPTADQLRVAYSNIEPGKDSEIVILDATGRLIAHRRAIQGRDVNEEFDVSQLPAGTYWVKVKMRHQVRTASFVKM